MNKDQDSSSSSDIDNIIDTSNLNIEEDWNIPDHSIYQLQWHKEPVYAVDCHPHDPMRFLTASGDGTVCLWDGQHCLERITSDNPNIEPLFTSQQHEDSVTLAKYSPNGQFFAIACLDGTVEVYHAEDGSFFKELDGPTDSVEFLCWFEDSSHLFAGCKDQTAWIWYVHDGIPRNVFSTDAAVTCGCLQDEYAILGTQDGKISASQVFHTLETCALSSWTVDHPLISLVANPIQPRIVAGGLEDGQVVFFQPSSGRWIGNYSLHSDSVESISFSIHYPRLLASGSTDGTIVVWDLERSTQRSTWRHQGAVVKVKWLSEETNCLLSCSADYTLQLWDGRSGEAS
eukprot:jgi/Galph1/4172/GphlegSOOS_G2862.1